MGRKEENDDGEMVESERGEERDMKLEKRIRQGQAGSLSWLEGHPIHQHLAG